MRAMVPFLVVLAVLPACAPDLSVHASRVTQPRVVVVRADPAEARPGAAVTWTATVVTPDGVAGDLPVDWAFCLVPRSPTDSSSVSTLCLGDGSPPDAGVVDGGADGGMPRPAIVPLTETGHVVVHGRIPSDACARVGPQVPPAAMDGTRQRPPDPDVTGGYYLPIRLTTIVESPAGDVSVDVAFARQRLRCALPDLPGQTATDFAAQYRDNVNPVLDVVTVAGAPAPADGTTHVPVPAGAPVELVASWTPESIEDYVAVDPVTRGLVPRTESMSVQWYTDAGAFAHDRTTSSDYITSSNTLSIDRDHAGPATVWIVLEDERGGVDTRVLVLEPT